MLKLVLSLLLAAAGPPFLYEVSSADQVIRETMNSTYDLHLPEARKAAMALESQFPDHPAGYTLMAETYWWEAQTDPGNKTIEASYYRLQQLAVDKAEAALKLNKYQQTEVTAYLASAWGSYARFQITQKGAYFSAMRSGLRAHRYAAQVYTTNPDYYDIWVGIGAFNYFTGSLPAVIKPFAFLIGARGDRDEGLRQLQVAMDRGRYAQTEARIVYYTALLEDKQFAAAFPVLQRLLSDHPDNFVMYTWVTDWYRQQGKNLEGADYFEKASESQLKRSPKMAQYALLEKAQLQIAQNHSPDARLTLAHLRAIADPSTDPLLAHKVQAVEKTLK